MVADAAMFGGTPMQALAYHLHMEAMALEEERRCQETVVTRGSDPWSFRCQLDRGHDGEHRCDNPMGEDTGVLTWRGQGWPWEWLRG
jgi:hypothetical protein